MYLLSFTTVYHVPGWVFYLILHSIVRELHTLSMLLPSFYLYVTKHCLQITYKYNLLIELYILLPSFVFILHIWHDFFI